MHLRGTAARCAAIEALDSRRLLSAAVDASTQTLNVVGTAGDDEITVRAHRNLINVVDVVITNAAGREETFVAVGRFRTINVSAGAGNDRIAIDGSLAGLAGDVGVAIDGGAGNDTVETCSLVGTLKMGDGNDRVKLATATGGAFHLFGGAGDDHLELGDGASEINGEAGNDTITLGDGASTVRGGAGNDKITVGKKFGRIEGNEGNDEIAVGALASASVLGGDGDDRITLRNVTANSTDPPTTAIGGDGDDTLVGSDSTDVLYGGGGNDIVKTGGGYGDLASGDAGNDVLDASGGSVATLRGGAGDDDFYAGSVTYAYGEGGRDWFEKSDGFYLTDFDKKTDASYGSVRNNVDYSSNSLTTIITSTTGAVGTFAYNTPYLRKLDDVGFIVVSNAGSGRSVGSNVETTTFKQVTDQFGYVSLVSVPVPRNVRPSPTLTAAERKGVRAGIVRLPAGWQLANPTVKQDGFVWYDTRFGKGGERAKSDEFGTVYQLCVKAGTVIVTSDGAYTSKALHVGRARADVAAMWLPAGATARIAGGSATTYVIADIAPQAAVKAKAKQRGILVEGGVIWLPFGDATTTFATLKFA